MAASATITASSAARLFLLSPVLLIATDVVPKPMVARWISVLLLFGVALLLLSRRTSASNYGSQDQKRLETPLAPATETNGKLNSRPPLRFTPSSDFNWSTAKLFFPVKPLTPLPRGPRRQLAKIQHNFGAHVRNDPVTDKRRLAVREAFVRSWDSYKKYAWLDDELKPVSAGSKNPFGGWAATLVDALDTLWIMDLQDEFFQAAQAMVDVDFGKTEETGVNLFETTIRHLGGLLSAYDLSDSWVCHQIEDHF
ncbi:glycoside hydrolase family 47 protein [Apiospora arundinis]|uniref:alpha-1,2-Mannosidase n=1 Tax=Apiospora arundinis TaxID=335852 RepID=A0ABR2J337_9PEZI